MSAERRAAVTRGGGSELFLVGGRQGRASQFYLSVSVWRTSAWWTKLCTLGTETWQLAPACLSGRPARAVGESRWKATQAGVTHIAPPRPPIPPAVSPAQAARASASIRVPAGSQSGPRLQRKLGCAPPGYPTSSPPRWGPPRHRPRSRWRPRHYSSEGT